MKIRMHLICQSYQW